MNDPIYRLRRDARYRLVDGEAVILLQDSGETLVLDEVGAAVLVHLDGRRGLAAVAASLVAEYEGEPARIRDDLEAFAAELSAAGVIEAVAPSTDDGRGPQRTPAD
ncbi:MAG: PqqD family protein [Acidobacteriota bacterium]